MTRIARRYYGKSSARIVRAVFDANRGVLSSPDHIRAGMTLVLPPVDGLRPRPDPERADRRADRAALVSMPASSERRPSRAWRWYQIRKGDRYISIAREQLGDGKRWREIYELNKDRFPDPSRIRAGVRIKIPIDSTGG